MTNFDAGDRLLVCHADRRADFAFGSDRVGRRRRAGPRCTGRHRHDREERQGQTALEITLNANATPDQGEQAGRVSILLKYLAFRHEGEDPTENTRSITIQLTEAGVTATASIVRTKQIQVVAVDDKATIAGTANPVDYTRGGSSVALNPHPGGTLTDPDSDNLNRVTLTAHVTSGPTDHVVLFLLGGETFTIEGAEVKLKADLSKTVATFTGGTNGDDLKITFTEHATPGFAQTLFQQIRFRTTFGATADDRIVTLTLDDSGKKSSVEKTVWVDGEDL